MRLTKIIGFLLLFSLFGFQNLNAQTQNKTTTVQKPPPEKKPQIKVKTVPTSSKTALKTALAKKAATARKQQIKKAVRRTNMTKRPIRRR